MGIQAGMENEPLTISVADHVATLAIDRPHKKNAITHAMWRTLAGTVADLSADPAVRVIVLTGKGADFSAGADIAEFETVRADAATARAYEAANSAAFAAIRNAPVPVIAAIRGICFGGGFGLAAACDLRIATPDARFAVPAARLGLAYPHDAMPDIVAALGPQMAKHLVFSAVAIDAQAARQAGFLLEIVAADALDGRVVQLAAGIARNAPLTVRASKAAIRASQTGSASALGIARELGDATFDSRDYAEGRAAFRDKRAPVFEGR